MDLPPRRRLRCIKRYILRSQAVHVHSESYRGVGRTFFFPIIRPRGRRAFKSHVPGIKANKAVRCRPTRMRGGNSASWPTVEPNQTEAAGASNRFYSSPKGKIAPGGRCLHSTTPSCRTVIRRNYDSRSLPFPFPSRINN